MFRIFDIFFSSLALIFLSPLILILVVILRFTGEGKIFFLQNRIGHNFVDFKVIKFATMKKNSPFIGTRTLTIKNDPRILPVGHYLRKTKINELPQLINIILGQMSLIGPRPLTKEALKTYSYEEQKLIFSIRPGLSGIGSIIFRNEEEILSLSKANKYYANHIAPYKKKLESWYIHNKSVKYYFLCIFITIWTVIFPNSKLVWKIFKTIPEPPENIKKELNFYN